MRWGKTIDEIGFQTNQLSLNAAVEAARAGEAGGLVSQIAGASHERAGGIRRANEAVAGINEVVGRISDNTRTLANGVIKFKTAKTNAAPGREIAPIDD